MRRLLFLLPVIIIALSSCTAKNGDYLSYQKDGLIVNGTYSKNDKQYEVKIERISPDSGRVTYLAPAEISGISFDIEKGSISLAFGDNVIPFDSETHDSQILLSLFMLDKEKMLKSNVTEAGGMTLNKVLFDGITVFIEKNSGEPVKIESNKGNRNIVLNISGIEKSGEGNTPTPER